MLHELYDGGAGASLEDYWKVMRSSKVAAGGFIWAFLDEDVKRTDKGGKLDSDGNQAPDGILGPYREKEGSFYAIKEIWSPVAVLDATFPTNSAISVENRFDFTDLNQCSFTLETRRFGLPDGCGYRVPQSDRNRPGNGRRLHRRAAAKGNTHTASTAHEPAFRGFVAFRRVRVDRQGSRRP